jgi:hypothetical protein
MKRRQSRRISPWTKKASADCQSDNHRGSGCNKSYTRQHNIFSVFEFSVKRFADQENCLPQTDLMATLKSCLRRNQPVCFTESEKNQNNLNFA